MKIRWLQWFLVDPRTHLGGAEIHSLCLEQALAKYGVETHYSSDPKDLYENNTWDVIQTHGSSLPKHYSQQILSPHPLRIHTLHATSLGEMWATGRWFSMGKIRAQKRENAACKSADLIASVHPNLFVLNKLKRQNKPIVVHGNAWNSYETLKDFWKNSQLDPDLIQKVHSFGKTWIFAGRGGDRTKGASLLTNLLKQKPNFKLIAAPGAGFEESHNLFKTGPLSPPQLRSLYEFSEGLIMPSYYETGPLVVMEALSLGLRVISTPTGVVHDIHRQQLQGIVWIPRGAKPDTILKAIAQAQSIPDTPNDRKQRSHHNRQVLSTWENVASRLWQSVEDLLRNKRSPNR